MTRGPDDWIVDADLRDALAQPLRAASAHTWRASPHGGPWPARLLARLVARLPGRRTRELAAALRDTLAAVRAAGDWQRARVEVLESLVSSLAAAVTPRPWLAGGERPFLLVGTGGGGTRVLAEAALRLGVLLGVRVNESFDSVEWAPLVYALVLDDAGDTRARILAQAAEVHVRWAIGDRPWGIKLPELTLVLPRFLDAFPGARVVFLARHPIPACLRRHHITSAPEHPIGRRVLDQAYRSAGRDPGRIRRDAPHLRNALSWRFQVERVTAALAGLPRERVLRLHLEDFQREPSGTTATLAAFLERPMSTRAVVRVDPQRLGSAARHDRRAAEVMAWCGPLAQKLGY